MHGSHDHQLNLAPGQRHPGPLGRRTLAGLPTMCRASS